MSRYVKKINAKKNILRQKDRNINHFLFVLKNSYPYKLINILQSTENISYLENRHKYLVRYIF